MDRPDAMDRKPSFDFVELHILHHASDGELYGLWMLEELAEHGYKLNASQLYPRFHFLEEQGFLSRTNRNVGGKIRKYYQLTPKGEAYLAEQKRRLLELVSEALSVDELTEALNRRKRRAVAKQAEAVTENES
jgi:PadR family transcriptional regulator, regulatory protein PadR